MLSEDIYIFEVWAYNARMNDELVSSLEDLGLSEKESKVYLANLALGPSSVQKIADYAGIKRVTAYVILESLVSLGLVSQSNKGKKTFFIAEDPVSLKRLLTKREDELKEQKHNFETILPDLQGLRSLPVDSPSVKFYDSPEGIKSIMETFYQTVNVQGVKQAYGISNIDQVLGLFPEFKAAESNPSRVSSGIASKIIYTCKDGPIFKAGDAAKNRESRFVPADKYPLNGDISIIGDHLFLMSLTGSKPVAVTIKSAELAKGMVGFFNLAWETAAKYNRK